MRLTAAPPTSLVAHEASQVGGLGGVVVLGEGLNLALPTAATLPGAEAQGTASRICVCIVCNCERVQVLAGWRVLVRVRGEEFSCKACMCVFVWASELKDTDRCAAVVGE